MSKDPAYHLDPDPLRMCEHTSGCREWKGLRLYPVVGVEDERTYHWFCDLHRIANRIPEWR